MRPMYTLCTALMLTAALPSQALAGDSPVAAEGLAAVQSLTDHCGLLNPEAASGFEDYLARYLKDIPEPEVVQLRASAAYKSGYAKATADLARRPRPEVAKVCKTLLAVSADLRAREAKPDETPPAAPVPKS